MTLPDPPWPDRTLYRQDIQREDRLGWEAWVQGEWSVLEQWARQASPRAVAQLWQTLSTRESPESLGPRGGLLRAVVQGRRAAGESIVALAEAGQIEALEAWVAGGSNPDAYEADLAVQKALNKGHVACASLLWPHADHFDPRATMVEALRGPAQSEEHRATIQALVQALPLPMSPRDWFEVARAASVGGWTDVLHWVCSDPTRQFIVASPHAQQLLDAAAQAHQAASCQWLVAHSEARVGQTVATLIHQGQMVEADTLLRAIPHTTRRELLDLHMDTAAHFPMAWQQQHEDEAQDRHDRAAPLGTELPKRTRTRS